MCTARCHPGAAASLTGRGRAEERGAASHMSHAHAHVDVPGPRSVVVTSKYGV